MQSSTRTLAGVSLGALVLLLLWDASGWDLALARLSGGATGFPLRDHWLATAVLHEGGKYAAWSAATLLCICAGLPVGPLRRLPFPRRLQLAASVLFATALVSLFKTSGATSCPWDLREFGGMARHVSHWTSWLAGDGGPGRCFPAGHASAGFAFAAGFFALRRDLPGLARQWLAGALIAGLVLGVAQQVRGAHFMSHTLWTAWICWIAGWLLDAAFDGASRIGGPSEAAA